LNYYPLSPPTIGRIRSSSRLNHTKAEYTYKKITTFDHPKKIWLMRQNSFSETLLYQWTKQLIGSNFSFTFNMTIISILGIAYSFKLLTSPVLLGLFGLLNPVLLTICVYRFIRELPNDFDFGGISLQAFSGRRYGLMLFGDLTIIVTLASLIFFNILNYFIFRFLLVFLLPIMLLVGLRFLFIVFIVDHQDKL
jgi:hypothetical protein